MLSWVAPFLLWLFFPALAREAYPGQYAKVRPDLQEWFQSQKEPLTGKSCCSEADGREAEEDIIQGHFWARWCLFYAGDDKPCTRTAWIPVPDEVVIREPNRNGAPVVWYTYESGVPKIRCYVPGAGI